MIFKYHKKKFSDSWDPLGSSYNQYEIKKNSYMECWLQGKKGAWSSFLNEFLKKNAKIKILGFDPSPYDNKDPPYTPLKYLVYTELSNGKRRDTKCQKSLVYFLYCINCLYKNGQDFLDIPYT